VRKIQLLKAVKIQNQYQSLVIVMLEETMVMMAAMEETMLEETMLEETMLEETMLEETMLEETMVMMEMMAAMEEMRVSRLLLNGI
jgi:hypothetical protein